jgi:hypothetical protein
MIAVSTTTITHRTGAETEPGEGRTFTTAQSRVRATIGSPTGKDLLAAGGGREVIDAVLNCDPITASHYDRIVDDDTAEVWEIVWVQNRNGLGLDHTRAGLKRVAGF